MAAITYTEAGNNLGATMDRVVDDHQPVVIARANGKNAVLISQEDFDAWQETAYLLRSSANAADLRQALAELGERRGLVRHDLIEQRSAFASEPGPTTCIAYLDSDDSREAHARRMGNCSASCVSPARAQFGIAESSFFPSLTVYEWKSAVGRSPESPNREPGRAGEPGTPTAGSFTQ
jgi:antitoxin YefM